MQASSSTVKQAIDTPVISIISAVYNVAAYLPAYLDSLDAQDVNPSRFEVILVNDGSPDESEDLIRSWMKTTRVQARLLTKDNGGQASARNLGLTVARGDWVTFCDPDDYLDPEYLREVFANMELNSQNPPAMYATRLVSYLEATDTHSHNHPLKRRFRDGTRVVDLNRSPDFFHMHGPTAIVNRAAAEEISLRFAEELRFSFEDAHYVATYLLAQPVPTIGYIDTAIYNYRIRAAQNSSVQIGATKPEKYTEVLRHGHLDLIEQCRSMSRPVPKWLQFMMLYDVLWYYRGDRRIGAPSKQLSQEVLQTFHTHMSSILGAIDEQSIGDFEIMPTDSDLRNALILGYQRPNFRSPHIDVIEYDAERQMIRLEYLYSGEVPNEQLTYRGRLVTPRIAKSQAIHLMGRDLFYRRHIWIPSDGTFTAYLDGVMTPLSFGRTPRSIYTIRPVQVQRHFRAGPGRRQLAVRGQKSASRIRRSVGMLEYLVRDRVRRVKEHLPKRRDESERLRTYINSGRATVRYNNAWVLIDRPLAANDNAEHLYRYLKTSRPGVNAWFVLARESSDWQRLDAEGFKLLEYGSREHFAALAHAEVYASSHLDRFITEPLPKALSVTPNYKFVFLQHGVTLHDQSAWFNSKKIDLLITASPGEYQSIVADSNTYKYTSKEVALTGFPRHDALQQRQADSVRGGRKTIVIAPTWRAGLLTPADERGRREPRPEFAASSYAGALRAVFSAEFVERSGALGYDLAYLPHPSMVEATAMLDIDPRVQVLSWSGQGFAQIMDQADIWVTDYSSTAFEAGYAGVPVIYYQFDQAEMASGLHIFDSGYFSFENDGFGPVVDTAEGLFEAVQAIERGQDQDKYDQRRAEAFPNRDQGNSARVYKRISFILKRTPAGKILEK